MNDSSQVSTRAQGGSGLGLYRWIGRAAVSTAAGCCALSCGGPAQESVAPVSPIATSTVEASSVAPEPVVVAPEPPDVVVVGRARSPGPMLTKLGEWAGFPLPWEDFLAQRLPRLATVLRTDLPADFAVALDQESKGFPDLYAVFSLALTDYEKGISALRESGEVIASEDERQVYVEVEQGVECTVARAPSHVRLVCGKHVALTTLGAFVVTNLSQQQVGNSDLFTELRLAPIYARYGKRAQALKVLVPALLREASIQNPRFDAAFAAAAHATVDDVLVLARELDSVRLSLDLQEAEQQALVHLDVRFRGSESFFPAAVAHAATNVGAAPPMFWSLPAESSSVSFSTFAKPFPRLVPVVDTLGELGAGALEHAGLATGVAERWLAELKGVLTTGGASAYAQIPDTEAPAESLGAALGVHIFGLEGDQGAAQRFADASVGVFNDKKLRAEVSKRSKGDVKDLPTVTTRTAPGAWGLPTGSKAYSITIPKSLASEYAKTQLLPEFAAKQGAFTVTAVVAKQGDRTWFGWGGNDAKVAAVLKSTIAAQDPALGLAQNPHLARWRSAAVNSAASVQVAQLFEPNLFGGGEFAKPSDSEVAIRSMPNGGKHFIHVKGTSDASGPTANLDVEVPKEALRDLVNAFVSLATK